MYRLEYTHFTRKREKHNGQSYETDIYHYNVVGNPQTQSHVMLWFYRKGASCLATYSNGVVSVYKGPKSPSDYHDILFLKRSTLETLNRVKTKVTRPPQYKSLAMAWQTLPEYNHDRRFFFRPDGRPRRSCNLFIKLMRKTGDAIRVAIAGRLYRVYPCKEALQALAYSLGVSVGGGSQDEKR